MRKNDFTWAKLKLFALGELGLKPDEFYSMTWDEYCYASHGYWVRHNRYLEGVRVIYWAIYTAHSDPKKGVKKLEQLMPLMTDKNKVKKLSHEDKVESYRKAIEFKNYLNGLRES